MNKKAYSIIITLVSVVVLLVISFLLKPTGDRTSHSLYLKHFPNTESNIFIDCKIDSDCKLLNLENGCGHFSSINKSNTKNEIRKYNEKEKELLKGVNFDCSRELRIEEYSPICKNNQCDFEKKSFDI